MADTDTTQTAAPAQTAEPSPAPEAAPAPQEAPKTGDQAIQESKGRQPDKPISARDFSRAMGAGNSQTSALIDTPTQETAPQQPQEQQAPSPEGGESTGEETAPIGDRTKPNRAGEPQPIDEQGRYQQKQEASVEPEPEAEVTAEGEGEEEVRATEDGAPPEPEATPEEGSQTETAEPEVAKDVAPEGMVRIEIPEALQRNFGTHQDVPEDQEEWFRWNINNQIRNSEVDSLKAEAKRAEKLEHELEEYRNRVLQTEVTSEAAREFKETDQYKRFAERYSAYLQAEQNGELPEGSASEYWQDAAMPAYRAFEAELLDSKTEEVVAEQRGQAAQQWAGRMWEQANELPDAITQLDGFQDDFEQALMAFDFEAQQGRFDHLKDTPNPAEGLAAAFKKYFNARLLGMRPEVSEAIKKAAAQKDEARRQQQTREEKAREAQKTARAKREEEETRRKEKEEAARKAATNPMGNVPSGQVHRHAEGAEPELNARQFDKLMTRRG